MKMRYDLATNFDDSLIERIGELGLAKNIKSLYGKLAQDIVGGGRSSFTLPNISNKQLKKHIELAHKNKIEFNYLFNALCMDNLEFIGKTNQKIRDFIKSVEELGADMVTVGSPFLLQMVKENSNLRVSVSVYNDIDSLERVERWEEFGADELTLHYSFNRNFKKLEQVLKSIDINLRLIANNVCLHDCIYRTNHANALAHSSQAKHKSKGFFLDFYALNCGKEKLENPAKLIAADWIRPEDVHYYEELCDKLGKNNLVLKLTDRAKTTDWLVRTVKAYSEKSYDGNLFDILNYVGNREYAQVHKGAFIKGALTGKAKGNKMLEFQKAIFLTKIYADNKSLESFMKHFVNGHDCIKFICDIGGWTEDQKIKRPIGYCDYCKTIAKKVLRFEGGEQARIEALEKCNRSLNDLKKGDMFRK